MAVARFGTAVQGSPASRATSIGRIGNDGAPFAVQSSKELTADRGGYLYLMVNDHPAWFGDNCGSVTARVRMLSAAPAAARGGETTEITIRQ